MPRGIRNTSGRLSVEGKKGGEVKVQGMDITTDSDVTFNDNHGESTRTVSLTQKDSGVEITLVRTGKREAQ